MMPHLGMTHTGITSNPAHANLHLNMDRGRYHYLQGMPHLSVEHVGQDQTHGA